ncbi:MAG: HAD family phosphatase [Bacteroidia bacterium]|nr:HAD family phosphatase [Bacteroidia bacterium]
MPQIRNILFDLGGVLYGIDYHRTTRALGISPEALPSLLQSPALAAYEKGLLETKDFLSYWQKEFPTLTVAELTAAWNAMLLGPLPQADEVLAKLASSFSLALLSNTNDLHLERVEPEIQPWKVYFAGIFFSNRIHLRKPDPDTYRYVLERLRWSASETLFVDDNELNIAGAQRAGLRTFHLSPPNQPQALLASDSPLFSQPISKPSP